MAARRRAGLPHCSFCRRLGTVFPPLPNIKISLALSGLDFSELVPRFLRGRRLGVVGGHPLTTGAAVCGVTRTEVFALLLTPLRAARDARGVRFGD